MKNRVSFLEPGMALSLPGLEGGVVLYACMDAGAAPSTLLVSLELVWTAYGLLPEMEHKLLIVPVPGWPGDVWAVCGGNGIVISDPV